MQKDYRPELVSLFEILAKHGFIIHAVDNGEFQVLRDSQEDFDSVAVEEALACDECTVQVAHSSTPQRRQLLYLVFGNEPGVLVCDYSCSDLLSAAVNEHSDLWEGTHQRMTY